MRQIECSGKQENRECISDGVGISSTLLILCVRTVPIYPEASNIKPRARLPTDGLRIPLQVWNVDDYVSLLSPLQEDLARMTRCPVNMEDSIPR